MKKQGVVITVECNKCKGAGNSLNTYNEKVICKKCDGSGVICSCCGVATYRCVNNPYKQD